MADCSSTRIRVLWPHDEKAYDHLTETRCPYHDDDSANMFVIHVQQMRWTCYGCGRSGTVEKMPDGNQQTSPLNRQGE